VLFVGLFSRAELLFCQNPHKDTDISGSPSLFKSLYAELLHGTLDIFATFNIGYDKQIVIILIFIISII